MTSPAGGIDDADLILRNGRIATMDAERPAATAVAIRGGRFVAVGDDAVVARRRGAATHVVDLAAEMSHHAETSPRLSGGDVDANWVGAYDSGDEAVGGSVATPDQDVVDEIGEALGVPQAPDEEVHTSEEILGERDRYRWRLEREAADDEEES